MSVQGITRYAKEILKKTYIKIYKYRGYKILHFLHIGKTGGTAIKNALLEENHSYFRRLIPVNKYLIVLHEHDFFLNHTPKDELVFFAVRDPLKRFVSGFYSRVKQGKKSNLSKLKTIEQKFFDLFPTANHLAEALSSPDMGLKQEAITAMGTIRHVKNSVWNWFVNEEYLKENKERIFFVLHQESLDADFISFQKKIGMKISSLPQDSKKSNKMPSNFDPTLSPLAIDNLKHWYREDLLFFELLQKIEGEL